MKFKYIASTPEGKILNGEMESPSSGGVLAWMASQNFKPISVKQVSGLGLGFLNRSFSQTIGLEDKIFLCKYLSLMLKVGTDLFHAIDVLVNDFDKPAVKSFLLEVKEAITKGQPFYKTFEKYPKYFSPVFVNLIKAGEDSGNLEKTFNDLGANLEKEEVVRNKIKSALIYPVLLISMAFTILFLLTSFALPKISQVFKSGNFHPPLFSRIVFAVGDFLNAIWFITIPLIIGSVIGSIIFSKSVIGKKIIGRLIIHVPLIGGVMYRLSIQRFAATLSSLMKSGMPINRALETTADAVGVEEMKDALYRISREGIAKGLTIGEAFQREVYFPKVLVNLISISEKAGHIDAILDTLANFYESEIDASIKTLLSLLEPAVLVVIGFIVGVIALSVIMPIYQLSSQI